MFVPFYESCGLASDQGGITRVRTDASDEGHMTKYPGYTPGSNEGRLVLMTLAGINLPEKTRGLIQNNGARYRWEI